MVNKDVMSEIASWSIEAKEEDTERYFYHYNDVNLIERGLKNFVIGRKGTGKTAIAEYLSNKKSHDHFSRVLSFGSFPFNILYDLKDTSYTAPNQYITIWEYVINTCICSMMAENHAVSSKIEFDLAKALNVDIEKALSKSIKTITSPGFGFSIFGVGANKTAGVPVETTSTWKEKSDAIAEFIENKIDQSTYYIMFDALDEDYKDILQPDRREKYFELLVGLFKAAQNVRHSASRTNTKIIPVIFIRDDIFDLCRDPDKNKWLDRSLKLQWDINSLEALIAFRISRATNSKAPVQSFKDAWHTVFETSEIRQNNRHRRSEDAFKYMLRSTFYRPRDAISYVRECAGMALKRGSHKINADIIKKADELQSEYMRREIIDEMHSIVDDIAEILDLFSEMRKPIFSKEEFDASYEMMYNSNGNKAPLSSVEILKLLYHFNVIGNVTTGNHQVFAYNTHKKSVNLRENLCIHRGLLKCLHIL
ncbi:P-loop ATPase, Sll1717 family [Rhizobium sp. Nf11,1]|uniref:P-loop ATPase, Sll1717 family n=1 Tax=Rhizobium sp. Nf11,1 TaxID=3404923 RepID=UPI003D331D6F